MNATVTIPSLIIIEQTLEFIAEDINKHIDVAILYLYFIMTVLKNNGVHRYRVSHLSITNVTFVVMLIECKHGTENMSNYLKRDIPLINMGLFYHVCIC